VKRPRISHPRRILISQLRRLGDVVLTTALLNDLRRAFPATPVDFLVGDRAAPLLEHHPLIHERLIYDRERPTRTWREVRRRHYDWVIDPQSSPRTAPIALLSGAPVRAGFATRVWGWTYTHRLPRAGRPTEYVARERQRLLEMLGVPITRPRTSVSVTPEERNAGRALLEMHGIIHGEVVVGLVLSSAEQAREWPPDHFATLANALAAERMRPVALETPGDEAKVLRAMARAPAIVRVAVPGLREFLGALTACDVLVSGNTGPAHMATAVGVARATICGPEPPAAWAPADDPSVIALRATWATALGRVTSDDPRYSTITSEVPPGAVLDAVRRLVDGERARAGRRP
jgi:ADP-heptose:LPS heptosyltransferase